MLCAHAYCAVNFDDSAACQCELTVERWGHKIGGNNLGLIGVQSVFRIKGDEQGNTGRNAVFSCFEYAAAERNDGLGGTLIRFTGSIVQVSKDLCSHLEPWLGVCSCDEECMDGHISGGMQDIIVPNCHDRVFIVQPEVELIAGFRACGDGNAF